MLVLAVMALKKQGSKHPLHLLLLFLGAELIALPHLRRLRHVRDTIALIGIRSARVEVGNLNGSDVAVKSLRRCTTHREISAKGAEDLHVMTVLIMTKGSANSAVLTLLVVRCAVRVPLS